jgi:hypothetical protein
MTLDTYSTMQSVSAVGRRPYVPIDTRDVSRAYVPIAVEHAQLPYLSLTGIPIVQPYVGLDSSGQTYMPLQLAAQQQQQQSTQSANRPIVNAYSSASPAHAYANDEANALTGSHEFRR